MQEISTDNFEFTAGLLPADLPGFTAIYGCIGDVDLKKCVAGAGGVRVGPGRPQRSWLHRLTATPMRTTSGQNWLQVMREKAAQPGQAGPGSQGAAPVPQLRPPAMSGQNMVSFLTATVCS